LVGVAEAAGWAAAGAGAMARTGGVPNRGGEAPIELDRAEASAEMPGPPLWEPGPGSGERKLVPLLSSPLLGLVFWWAGETPYRWEGTGDARRAVNSARGAGEVP